MKQAQLQLFDDRARIEQGALMTKNDSMSGQVTAPFNEQEKLVDATDSERSSRAAEWKRIVTDLHRTEPLPGKSATSSSSPDQVQANTAGAS